MWIIDVFFKIYLAQRNKLRLSAVHTRLDIKPTTTGSVCCVSLDFAQQELRTSSKYTGVQRLY